MQAYRYYFDQVSDPDEKMYGMPQTTYNGENAGT